MLRALLLIINLFKPCKSLICGYIMASYMAYNIERSIKARNFVQLQTVELSVISVSLVCYQKNFISGFIAAVSKYWQLKFH